MSAAHPDPITDLTRDVYYHLAHTLRAALPPPVNDSPQDILRRDRAMIAHVASLVPATIQEANLAANYVAACDHALDCLRIAHLHEPWSDTYLKCLAQSARMWRESRAALNLLLRLQSQRREREAAPAASDEARRAEQHALSLLAPALHEPPAKPAPAPPPPAPAPQPVAAAPQPALTMTAAADRYAREHRKRARLIRRFGRVPDKLDFGPLKPELIKAIATGQSEILRSLDEPARPPLRAAA